MPPYSMLAHQSASSWSESTLDLALRILVEAINQANAKRWLAA
jgi:hypothetical protein